MSKIGVIGAGSVGATVANDLMIQGVASEIVLVDINTKKAKGEAMDIYQGAPFCSPAIVRPGEYEDVADMFINLTLEDTFPTVNIEALACGIPIITYKTGGSPEILNGDTGYCVDKFDFNDIIEKIDVILRNGRAFYEEKCIARANNRYDYKKKFLEYIELYKEIMAKE